MKYIFTLLVLSTILSGCLTCNPPSLKDDKVNGILPLKDKQVYYEFQEPVASVTKQQLFRRARRWFVDNFYSSKAVLQLTDSETGEVVGRGKIDEYTYVTFSVDLKDGYYRIRFSTFETTFSLGSPGKPMGEPVSLESMCYNQYSMDYIKRLHKRVLTTAVSFDRAMNSSSYEKW